MCEMNIAQYIVNKWNTEAEQIDKFKVNILTILNTAAITILSVRGFATFFDIKLNSILIYIALISWGFMFFKIFKLWQISKFIKSNDIDPERGIKCP
jgi:hypothetical protein